MNIKGKYFIEFLFVRFMEFIFRSVSRALSLKWGEWVGTFFSFLLPRRNRIIIENLEHAFPEKKPAEIKKIARGVWRNIGRTAAEFIRMDEINQSNYLEYFSVEGEEIVKKAVEEGRGVVLIGFHMTNWEMTGCFTALHFGNLTAIARPIKNLRVEEWVHQKRGSSGIKIILHRNAAKESLRHLKKGKVLGILVDQNLYQGGVFVDFFGRPAATTTLPAILFDRMRSPVVICYSMREGDKLKVIYEGPLNLPRVSDQKERIFLHTQFINHEIEKIVRKNPENWFWIHDRWKRRPEESSESEFEPEASLDE